MCRRRSTLAGSAQWRSSRRMRAGWSAVSSARNCRTSAKSAAWSVTVRQPAAGEGGGRRGQARIAPACLEQVEPRAVRRGIGQVVAGTDQDATAAGSRFAGSGRGPASSCRCPLRRRGARAGRDRRRQRQALRAAQPVPAPGRRGSARLPGTGNRSGRWRDPRVRRCCPCPPDFTDETTPAVYRAATGNARSSRPVERTRTRTHERVSLSRPY